MTDINDELYQAVLDKSLEKCEALLQTKKVNINAKYGDGITVLHVAASLKKLEIVELLIKYGADALAIDKGSKTPLDHAILFKAGEDITKLLEESMANQKLFKAAKNNNFLEVQKLIKEKKADVNATNKDGDTPLHCAARNGHTEAVKVLIKNGADVNARDERGYTPLYVAVMCGHKNILTLLLEKGKAKIDVQDNSGRTSLFWAVLRDKHIVEYLISHDADITIIDKAESTALSYCQSLDVAKPIIREIIKLECSGRNLNNGFYKNKEMIEKNKEFNSYYEGCKLKKKIGYCSISSAIFLTITCTTCVVVWLEILTSIVIGFVVGLVGVLVTAMILKEPIAQLLSEHKNELVMQDQSQLI
ncbi:ankyrin repeat domain-containing protein [Wolbachia endosymbiont of Pentidionis agamae]|uniref:ankyrin repeat domain-containing protein n=1 Tax=Wolbachia endosymbiont of Pentidionis agamae TaxID=3110435 RepID=UPI002FD0FF2B